MQRTVRLTAVSIVVSVVMSIVATVVARRFLGPLTLGDLERIYPAQSAADAARALLRTIRVQIVPDAHHVTAIAQPEAVNVDLLRFLDAGRLAGPRLASRTPKAVGVAPGKKRPVGAAAGA